MPCKANIRQIGDVAIVDLSGRITLGDGSGIVRETVKDMLKKGQKNLLLNLGDVSYIDSSAAIEDPQLMFDEHRLSSSARGCWQNERQLFFGVKPRRIRSHR
jgi:hypothetical protein